MSITNAGSFLYHGSAFGLSARFDHPSKVTIPTQAVAVLAPTGGESSSTVGPFKQHDVLFEEASARAVGSEDPDGSRHTDVTATVRKLRFLQLVQADLVVARVNSIHRLTETRDGVIDEAEVTFTGSNISGLFIAGERLEFELDTEVFSRFATFERLRKGDPKLGTVYAHGGVKDAVVRSSIVSRIGCEPLSKSERKKVADPSYILPGVRSDGNVVWVPHFGKIFIGEVIVQRGYRRINMLRMELGCGTGGGGTVGGGEGNGGEIPPTTF
jgi:hypothetical protein